MNNGKIINISTNQVYHLPSFLTCLLLVMLTTSMQAQEQKNMKHEVGFTPFRIEANSATHNTPFVPKGIFGAYYQRDMGGSNFSWYSAVDYGLNRIDDHEFNCKGCYGYAEGIGYLTELNVLSGAKFYPFKRKLNRLRPFLQANAHFAFLRYEGRSDYGFYLTSQLGNRSVFGLSFFAGVNYQLSSKMQVSLFSGYRGGSGPFVSDVKESLSKEGFTYHSIDYSFAPVQLSLGYRF